MEKKNGLVPVLVAGVLGYVLFVNPDVGNLKLDKLLHLGGKTPVVTPIVEPSAELKTLVEPVVKAIKAGPNAKVDGKLIGNFYTDGAEVIGKDPNVSRTTMALRNAHMDAGQLMFTRLGIKGKYPGLSEAIEKVFMDTLGNTNRTLSQEDRDKLVKAMQAIAWAGYQGAN